MKHKILLVLLLSSMACITATAQKVSMDFRQVKLAKVFDAITQQTGLTVAYSRPTVNPDKLVTVRADEEELAHVLDRLLAGMGVTYEISGKKVYLKAKAASEATHQSGKVKKISGVIVDEKGEPVIGASIAVKGTSLGTITNVDGEYTLMGVPEKAEVVISFIGYKTRTFSAGDKALANITLKEDSELLEEAVGLAAVHVGADNGQQLADDPAAQEAEQQAHEQAVDDLDPFIHVNSADSILNSDGGAGQAGDQAVALAGGNPEIRGAHAIYHNGKKRRAERNQCLLRIAAEINHVADGGGHGAVDVCHDQHAEKIKDRAGQNRRPRVHASGRDAGGDGIGRIGPPIDKNDAKRQQHGDQQNRTGRHGV